MISTYSRVRASGFGYGWPYQPSTTCGPDGAEAEDEPAAGEVVHASARVMAVATGVRADIWQTAGAELERRWSAAPYQASGVKQSEP